MGGGVGLKEVVVVVVVIARYGSSGVARACFVARTRVVRKAGCVVTSTVLVVSCCTVSLVDVSELSTWVVVVVDGGATELLLLDSASVILPFFC